MSIKNLFSSIVGHESHDGEPDLSKQEERAIVLTAEEAAEAVIEAQLAEAEKNLAVNTAAVEKHDSLIEVLEDKVENLEEAIDGMEQMRSGATEFNPELFAHYHKTAVNISNAFGTNLSHHGVESFATKDSTELVILAGNESMKDIAVKALEKAKEFLIELWNSAAAAIASIGNTYKQVAASAKALESKVSGETVQDGDVTLPADAFLLAKDFGNPFQNSIIAGIKDFAEYIPSENSYGSMVKTLSSGNFIDAEVSVNKEAGTMDATRKSSASTSAKALGEAGVKKLLKDVIAAGEGANAAEDAVKKIKTQRDKSIASMGKDAKSEEYVAQKTYGRLSAKLALSALTLNGRILKAQLAVAKANLK